MTATTEKAREHSLDILMRSLKLPAFARYAEEVAREAEKEGWSFRRYLHHLAELEIEERRQRRIERNQRVRASRGEDPRDAEPRPAAAEGPEDPSDALRG